MNSPERKWKRTKVDIRVKVRRTDDSSAATFIARTYELSEGGMSIYASETLEIGLMLAIEMVLPSCSRALSLKAEVRNHKGFRYGLQFMDIHALDRKEIGRYVASVAHVIEI